MVIYISGLYHKVTSINSILVVCNRFSKMSHFIVMIQKIIVEGLVKVFRDNI